MHPNTVNRAAPDREQAGTEQQNGQSATDLALDQRTVAGQWRRAVAAVPGRVFVRSVTGHMTYAEFDRSTDRLASGLAELGLAKGDKLALFLPNSEAFIEAFLAAAKLGVIYVPINTEYCGEILQYQLNRSDVTHILVDGSLVAELAAVQHELVQLTTIIVREALPDRSQATGLVHPFAERFDVRSFDQLKLGVPEPEGNTIDYTDALAISFTSGTTGPSKGVLATNCHVVSFALDWIRACGVTRQDRLFTCLPMFHAIAAWLGIVPAIILHTEISFVERFSARRFWDDVRRFDATVVHGIFSIVPILLKQPRSPLDAEVPARLFYIGQRNEEFEQRFNCRIVEVYGATETGIVTYSPIDKESPSGSCGMANARTYHVALLDDQDNEVGPGEVGEIAVRPRQPFSMFQEYYNMPRETIAAFRNQWFHTGDNARLDADGYFYFADRKKDVIRRRGENISSFELERVLNADDRILECAAIAVPSELAEDEVKIVVVPQVGVRLDHGQLARELWKTCDERMPRAWRPRFLEFRQHLPKTPNGKVRKVLLREGFERGTEFDREAKP